MQKMIDEDNFYPHLNKVHAAILACSEALTEVLCAAAKDSRTDEGHMKYVIYVVSGQLDTMCTMLRSRMVICEESVKGRKKSDD